MNTEQTKAALLLFRPGMADADVPELSAALDLAKRDPALRQWFESHLATQGKISGAFQVIPVPAGLREQIISERPWHSRPVPPRALFAVAMAMLLVLTGAAALAKWLRYREATSFAGYEKKMVAVALYNYDMNLATNDLQVIRAYLAGHHAPADYVMPGGLEKATALGCVAMRWREHPVAMICLRTIPKSPAEPGNDVWFFVVDEAAAHGAPTASGPKYAEMSGLGAASWSSGGRTYLLAARGGRPVIKDLLGGVLN